MRLSLSPQLTAERSLDTGRPLYCTKECTDCAPLLAFLLALFLPFGQGSERTTHAHVHHHHDVYVRAPSPRRCLFHLFISWFIAIFTNGSRSEKKKKNHGGGAILGS